MLNFNNIPLENNSIVQPKFCFPNCNNSSTKCKAEPFYSINQITAENFINKLLLEEELKRHGHPTSLKMPKTKRQRNVEEGKRELIAHYRYAHGMP